MTHRARWFIPQLARMGCAACCCTSLVTLPSCSDEAPLTTDDHAQSDDDTDDDDTDDDDTSDDRLDAPASSSALLAFLEASEYASWEKESSIHPSSAHVRVRTYLSPELVTSLGEGNDEHPIGSAAVKEQFDSEEVLVGWAVAVKVADAGSDLDVYWFEAIDDRVVIDDRGAPGCIACHADGSGGFLLTAWPLE